MSTTVEEKRVTKIGPHDCKLCHYIAIMPPRDAKAVREALDAGVQHLMLSEILTSNGYPISEASIRRHRRHRH